MATIKNWLGGLAYGIKQAIPGASQWNIIPGDVNKKLTGYKAQDVYGGPQDALINQRISPQTQSYIYQGKVGINPSGSLQAKNTGTVLGSNIGGGGGSGGGGQVPVDTGGGPQQPSGPSPEDLYHNRLRLNRHKPEVRFPAVMISISASWIRC